MNINQINILVLAYLGYAIYETYIRTYLIQKGYPTVKQLQEVSLSFVSAKSQSRILKKLLDEDFFTLEEQEILKRARNAKSNHKPKNSDILTYKHATALEALIGYLHLTKQDAREKELLEKIVEE